MRHEGHYNKITQELVDDISYGIIGCAIDVHKELGPGLLESIYEECMKIEMRNLKIKFESQVPINVIYKGVELNKNYFADLIVEDLVVVELKTVDKILPIHEAQLLTYLKLFKKPKGIIINFKTENISKSLKSMVSEYYEKIR